MKFRASLLLPAALALLAVCSLPAQSIVGAWSFGDTTQGTTTSGVLVFFSNNTYFHIENTADMNGTDGFERGSYSWSGNGSQFDVVVDRDTNGDIGLSTLDADTTLSIVSNSLILSNADGPLTGDSDPFPHVSGSDEIVGAWYTGNVTTAGGANDSAVLIFLANGSYFLARDNLGTSDDEIEHGMYTWDSGTGAFAFNGANFIDQVSDTGLRSAPLVTSFSVSGSVLTGYDGATFTLDAVSPIPEPSTYAMFAGLGALGLAVWHRRRLGT